MVIFLTYEILEKEKLFIVELLSLSVDFEYCVDYDDNILYLIIFLPYML